MFLTPRISEIVVKGFLTTGKEPEPTKQSQARPPPREVEIIRLLAEGKANKEIAAELGIAIRRSTTHRAKIMPQAWPAFFRRSSFTMLIRHKISAAPSATE